MMKGNLGKYKSKQFTEAAVFIVWCSIKTSYTNHTRMLQNNNGMRLYFELFRHFNIVWVCLKAVVNESIFK